MVRTLEFLAREALVECDGSGAIVEVAWPALLERWAADYDLVSRRRVLRLIAPRGPASIAETLRAWPKTYAVTRSLAAAQWAPYAEARLGILYAPDADELSEPADAEPKPSASAASFLWAKKKEPARRPGRCRLQGSGSVSLYAKQRMTRLPDGKFQDVAEAQ